MSMLYDEDHYLLFLIIIMYLDHYLYHHQRIDIFENLGDNHNLLLLVINHLKMVHEWIKTTIISTSA